VLCNLAQHRAEVAEGVPADDRPVPVGPDRCRPGVRAVYVEVVVPEIGEDFEELAFAPDRPQQRGSFDFVVGLDPNTPRRARFHVVLPELSERLIESGEARSRDSSIAFAIVDSGRVELLINPDLESLRIISCGDVERSDIPGAGAETESIESDDRGRWRCG
jgi:hypothetical protein